MAQTIYYVDADAVVNGDGTSESPFNDLDEVFKVGDHSGQWLDYDGL